MNLMYSLNSAGSASSSRMPLRSVFHPLNSVYTGSTGTEMSNGSSPVSTPPTLYEVQTLMVSKSSRQSDYILIRSVTPSMMTAYLSATRSSQPQRRGRPVTAPNS